MIEHFEILFKHGSKYIMSTREQFQQLNDCKNVYMVIKFLGIIGFAKELQQTHFCHGSQMLRLQMIQDFQSRFKTAPVLGRPSSLLKPEVLIRRSLQTE